MGEYDREQRNQLSRAVANSIMQKKKSIKQELGFIDNRIIQSKLMQFTHLSDADGEINRHSQDHRAMYKKYHSENNNITPDPDGYAALGLKHWATETRRASAQHYNELHALSVEGGINNGAYLGSSNMLDPDIRLANGIIEVKTNDSEFPSDVDNLVNNALMQLNQRGKVGDRLKIYVFLENKENTWPYTKSDGRVILTSSSLAARIKQRRVGWTSLSATPVEYHVYYSHNDIGYMVFTGSLNGS